MESIIAALVTGAITLFGVLIANIDIIVGTFNIDPTMKPIITALVMAVLTPIMAELGGKNESC